MLLDESLLKHATLLLAIELSLREALQKLVLLPWSTLGAEIDMVTSLNFFSDDDQKYSWLLATLAHYRGLTK